MSDYSSLQDFLYRADQFLDPISGQTRLREVGDLELVPETDRSGIRPAAVLIPIIPRPSGPTALFTKRPDTMAAHPGQVAFPGGKVEAEDRDDVAAALREAAEEVGVIPETVELVARAAPYITGSAFRITPVVGLLPADFVAQPDPQEVAATFETPLDFLLNVNNHKSGSAFWMGQERTYYEIPWQGFRIWGVTAGIIRDLYSNLYQKNSSEEKI